MTNYIHLKEDDFKYVIHTSDRIFFRRCRRRWNWSSPLRMDLTPIGEPIGALWFGTGFHFALEDFHGKRMFHHPADAFDAYYDAHRQRERPTDSEDYLVLAREMLEYYEQYWHPKFGREFRTASWHDLHMYNPELPDNLLPVTEVEFVVPLAIPGSPWYGNIAYGGRFDRIVIDAYGRLWVMDFKTAGRMDTAKLETDPQASAYTWAASKYYGVPFEGVIWMQFLKEPARKPRRLANGDFSQNRQQRTTHTLYRNALIEAFGKVPSGYIDFLNHLAAQEMENGDKFIRYDLLRRNQDWVAAEEWKIVMEASEMTNPDLPLYPNPTKDCSWDCPFRSPCLALDDGSDFEFMLESEYVSHRKRDQWRERLKYPEVPVVRLP